VSEKTALGKMATDRFSEGYNCAQSVLMTMFEHWNGKNVLIPKIATGFGGGIGRCGSLCGALAGGVMAIGIKYGPNDTSAKKRLKTYEVAQDFYKKFEKRHGSVLCRELIGYDLSDPDDLEKAREAKVFDKKCAKLVQTAIELLVELTE